MKTTKALSAIVGQPLAVEQAMGLFNYSALGGPLTEAIRPRLVYGPSGTGKTFLLNALESDCRAAGAHVVRVNDCDAIALQSGADTQDVIDAIGYSINSPVVLILDEAQKIFKGSKNKSAMERDLCQFIFPHGDYVKNTVCGKIDGKEITADFRNLILVLATNEKESLETSESRKRGEFPFARRFSEIVTTLYSQETMEEIIPAFFAKNGFKIGECASGLVNRLHRGNMAALCAVFERVKENVTDKKTVSKEDILHACKLTDYLPRGLKKGEARLLDTLATQGEIRKPTAQVISGHFGKLLEASIHHMRSQVTTRRGEVLPFPLIAEVGGSKLTITEDGKRFVESLKKDGFSW